jgi:hypothetical protein
MKNPNDLIGNRNRNLLACTTVFQPPLSLCTSKYFSAVMEILKFQRY